MSAEEDARKAQPYLDAAQALTVLHSASRDAYAALVALGDQGMGIASELDLAGLGHRLAGYSENLRREGLSAEVGGWPPPKRKAE